MLKEENQILDWIIVIPARISSSRLPRKPLIDIYGKSMIERTYNCAVDAVKDNNKIIIATDSIEIKNRCEEFGANCLLTSDECLTGTDRVAEVSRAINARQYINLQGDEPIFPSEEIKRFIEKSSVNPDQVYTAVMPIKKEQDFFNNSIPKMVFSKKRKLLYSSRAPIPASKSGKFNFGFKHICVYAFNKEHLHLFSQYPSKTMFEAEEDLEINRFLELGIDVNCIELKKCGKAVDNLEDLKEIKKIIRTNP